MGFLELSTGQIIFVLACWLLVARFWYRQRTVPVPLVPHVEPNELQNPPLVSIIVPARNEAHHIAACVQSLLAQDYPRFEVIVVNDCSEDDTGLILDRLAAVDHRLTVVHGKPLPEDWVVGRIYPIYEGYQVAQGDWLLITDADTIHAPGLLTGVMALLLPSPASYATVLGFVHEPTLGAYVMNLAVCAFLFMLTNPKEYYNPKSSMSQLNGQYMIFAREAYEAIGTHAAVRHYPMDDTTMGYFAKLHGYVPLLMDGRHMLQTTMYRTLAEAWSGWSRLMINSMWILWGPGLGSVLLILRSVILWLLWMTPWILGILGTASGDKSLLVVGGLQLLAGFAAFRIARGDWLGAVKDVIAMPFSILLTTAAGWWVLARIWFGRQVVWKGRVVRMSHRLPPWKPQAVRTRN